MRVPAGMGDAPDYGTEGVNWEWYDPGIIEKYAPYAIGAFALYAGLSLFSGAKRATSSFKSYRRKRAAKSTRRAALKRELSLL